MTPQTRSGSRPIEAVGTAVAAFVGLAEDHPVLMAAGVLAVLAAVAAVVRTARVRPVSSGEARTP